MKSFFSVKDIIELFVRPQPEITDAQIEFYQNHPEELDLIIDKEQLHLSFLQYFFGVGFLLMVGSRVVIYIFSDTATRFVTEVVLEATFELGNAILGGVIAAFLLEYLQKKQYEENIRYRRDVLARIQNKTSPDT